jgi:hypothetical protein
VVLTRKDDGRRSDRPGNSDSQDWTRGQRQPDRSQSAPPGSRLFGSGAFGCPRLVSWWWWRRWGRRRRRWWGRRGPVLLRSPRPSAGLCVAEHGVVLCSLARVAKHFISFVEFAHAVCGRGVSVDIGVVLSGEPPVRGLYDLLLRARADLEYVVVVFHWGIQSGVAAPSCQNVSRASRSGSRRFERGAPRPTALTAFPGGGRRR